MVDCFSWKNGAVLFEWRTSFLKRVSSTSIVLPAVFYHGFKSHLSSSRIASFIEEKGSYYVGRAPEFYNYQNHLAAELPAPELFDMVNGVATCSSIISDLDVGDAALALYTLDYLRALTYDRTPGTPPAEAPFPIRERKSKQVQRSGEDFEDLSSELADEIEGLEVLDDLDGPTLQQPGSTDVDVQKALEDDLQQQWETIREKNYYEIFGMTPNSFSFDKLKECYFELTRTYGPEKFFASSGAVMELA
jgi:hypothetical protein